MSEELSGLEREVKTLREVVGVLLEGRKVGYWLRPDGFREEVVRVEGGDCLVAYVGDMRVADLLAEDDFHILPEATP